MMTPTNLTEELNVIINQAIAGGLTFTQVAAALTAQAAAVTAAAVTHDRTMQDPGTALNPSQP
jgi:hypothetical protein